MSKNQTSIHVEISTPDGAVFNADGVDMVVAKALDGEFGIMYNHEPLAAALKVWPVRIITGDKEERIAVFGGFMEVKDNVVTIVSRMAEVAENIDEKRAMEARERALSRLKNPGPDIDFERAEAALQRAINRLRTIDKL